MSNRIPLLLGASLLLSSAAAHAGISPWACAATGHDHWDCLARKQPGAGLLVAAGTPVTADPTATAGADPEPAGVTPAVTAGKVQPPPVGPKAIDERWRRCPPPAEPRFTAPQTADGDDRIRLSADTAESSGADIHTLQGNAVVNFGDQQLQADTLVYDRNLGAVDAEGNVRYRSPGLYVNSERARLFPDEDRGSLHDIDYVLPESHGRGSASAAHLEDRQHQHLEQASYTTCAPGNDDWVLAADDVRLDQETGTGVARDAKLRLNGVPVLYTPYISFPIDERRKSGLLVPRFGQSNETGIDLSVPYYWNIAPHRDATLVPRYMRDRGLMLGTEFRYLNRQSRGTLNLEYLPSDDLYGNDRHAVSLQHNWDPAARLRTRLIVKDVSDSDYFVDLGTGLVQSSATHLERSALATYHGDGWLLQARLQDYQTIDPGIAESSKPYRRLPQIRFKAKPPQRFHGLQFALDSEFTEFDQDVRISGARLDILPRVSLPLNRAAWFMEPALSLRHTAYRLDDVSPGDPDAPERTTPVFSLDAGTFLDRAFSWKDSAYTQTLEPRLFYLYVPNREQDDIPVFDTGEYDFNIWQLFQENRFSGPDRMGDANQLALTLTTRILDPATGVQKISASLGELFYFRDREVTLPGRDVETTSRSDVIGEFGLELDSGWNAGAGIIWDPHAHTTRRSDFRVQYRAGKRQLVNLSYRFRDETLEQTDFSVLWPLGRSWHAIGRWNYALDSRETLEAIGGLGYESCCWAAQLVGRSYVNDEDGDRNTGVYLQIELKGLTSSGRQVDRLLERGILGYQSVY
jgi:LPS-assembly protein